jgi:hypothetical protein
MAKDPSTPATTGGLQSQAQEVSHEPDYKAKKDPTKPENADEIQFFDTSFAKLVEREDEDGKKQWVEVVSDNLYPGEKLKSVVDAEKAEKKAERDKATRERALRERDAR